MYTITNSVKAYFGEPAESADKPVLSDAKVNFGNLGTTPDIAKAIDGTPDDTLELHTKDESFNYQILLPIGDNVLGYSKLQIIDEFDKRLDDPSEYRMWIVTHDANHNEVKRERLLHDEGTGVTILREATADAAKPLRLVFTLTNEAAVNPFDFSQLTNKTLLIQVKTKLKSGELDNTIGERVPNTATVILNENRDDAVTSAPVYIVPPTRAKIDKKILDADGDRVAKRTLSAADLDGTLTYSIMVNMPLNARDISSFVVKDKLSENMVYLDYRIFEVADGTKTLIDSADLASGAYDDPDHEFIATLNADELKGKQIEIQLDVQLQDLDRLDAYLTDGKQWNEARLVITKDSELAPITDRAAIVPETSDVLLQKDLNRQHESGWPADEQAVFRLEKQVNGEWTEVQESIAVQSFEPVRLTGLLPGNYRLVETAAPAGYVPAPAQSFAVPLAAGVTTVTVNNSQLPGFVKGFAAGSAEQLDASDPASSVTYELTAELADCDGYATLAIADVLHDGLAVVPGSLNTVYEATGDTTDLPVARLEGQTIRFDLDVTDSVKEKKIRQITITFAAKLKADFDYASLMATEKNRGLAEQRDPAGQRAAAVAHGTRAGQSTAGDRDPHQRGRSDGGRRDLAAAPGRARRVRSVPPKGRRARCRERYADRLLPDGGRQHAQRDRFAPGQVLLH